MNADQPERSTRRLHDYIGFQRRFREAVQVDLAIAIQIQRIDTVEPRRDIVQQAQFRICRIQHRALGAVRCRDLRWIIKQRDLLLGVAAKSRKGARLAQSELRREPLQRRNAVRSGPGIRRFDNRENICVDPA